MPRHLRIEGDETPHPEGPEQRSDAYLRGCRLPRVGEKVGDLVVTSEPSSGPVTARMAAVDAAGSPLVLELLLPRVAAHPDASVSFAARARAVASQRHPALPEARATGFWCGIPFVAFTPIPGPTLDEVLSDNAGQPMPASIAAAIGIAVAEALAALHSAVDPEGYPVVLVHGRLDPSRIILPTHGGVALDATLAPPAETVSGGSREAQIAYASPEQLVSSQVDARSDIYSLGALLFELFTGQPAFSGDASAIWKARLAHARPRRVGAVRKDIPPFVEALIDACLDPDATRRPPNAREVASTLRLAFRVGAPPAAPSLEPPRVSAEPAEGEVVDRNDTELEMPALGGAFPAHAEAEADDDATRPFDGAAFDGAGFDGAGFDGAEYGQAEQSGERPSRPVDDWGGATEVLHAQPQHAQEVLTPEPVELDAHPSVRAAAAARTVRMGAIELAAIDAAIEGSDRESLVAQDAAAIDVQVEALDASRQATTKRPWTDKLFAFAVLGLGIATVVTWVLVDL